MLETSARFGFWFCSVLLLYTYAIYPVILAILRLLGGAGRPRDGVSNVAYPVVSVLVSVFNEESLVGPRVRNLLSTLYPADRMEILVGSDGSDDRTNQVLSEFGGSNVRVFLYPARRGKAAVLNDLVKEAKGTVIVFTDANTTYDADTIPQLVGLFTESSVGGVCGELRLSAGGSAPGSDGEVSYWSYENYLKSLESDLGTILGASGAVYAIRKELYPTLPTDKIVMDDFLIALGILRRGYSVKYNPLAKASEASAGSVTNEFKRKVRIGTANFFAIREFKDLLHPRRGFVAFALWSHKMIRWFAPVLLIVLFGASLLAMEVSDLYRWCVYLELVFIGLAAVGYIGEKLRLRLSILSWPYYFLAMNAALLVGMIRFLLDVRRPHWDVVR